MKIGSILILSALSSLFLSCEDVLDTKTVNEWDDNKVWKLSDLAQGVLMQAYSAIPNTPNCFDNNFLDAATDNATMMSDQNKLTTIRVNPRALPKVGDTVKIKIDPSKMHLFAPSTELRLN